MGVLYAGEGAKRGLRACKTPPADLAAGGIGNLKLLSGLQPQTSMTLPQHRGMTSPSLTCRTL